MRGLLPIQLRSLDVYFKKRNRWVDAINRYTARASCDILFSGAIAAFYSPFEEDGKLLLEGLREGFQPILDRQISAVCKYLCVEREGFEVEYLL